MPASDHRAPPLGPALEAGRLGVWEWDRESGTVAWSAEMEALAGLEPGSFGGSFDDFLDAVHPDDRVAVGAAVEVSLATGRHLLEHRFLRPDGRVTWVEGRGATRHDDAGRVTGMVGVAVDVTDRVRRRRRLESEQPILVALNRISLQLNSEHDRDRLGDTIAEVAAEACDAPAAALVRRPSILHPWEVVAQAGRSPVDLGAVADEVVRTMRDHPTGEPGVVRIGRALAVPVGSTLDLTDLLVVADVDDGGPADHAERLLAGIAAHAATALENARLHGVAARELAARNAALAERDEVMRQLQRSLLPPALPSVPHLDLAGRYLPMTEGIGGDFYDVFPLPDDAWGIVLGDVCGKGPVAAGVTSLARHTLRAAAMAQHAPAESVRILNDAMVDRHRDARTFATLVDARLRPSADGVRIQAAVAGHPPLLVLRADGRLERHGPTGHLVGMFDEIAADELELRLDPGDLCVFYTDGATDVRRDGVVFGDDRLAEVVQGCRGMSADAVARSVEVAVVDFQRGDISDDLALVVARVPG
ncbi:MAG: SpoIIE family protein phosphatase [Acidimicrobiia bacterium]